MRRWLVLLAALTLTTGLMGCSHATKWHECTACEMAAAGQLVPSRARSAAE